MLSDVLAKIAATKIINGPETIDVIEQVICLCAELHGKALTDVKILEKRGVHKSLAVSIEDIAAAIAKLRTAWIARKHRSGSWTEDLSAERFASGSRGAGNVGANTVREYGKRRAILNGYIGVGLPTSNQQFEAARSIACIAAAFAER